MATPTFVTKRHQWKRNTADSRATKVRPAKITDFVGEEHPGVLISQGDGRFMLIARDDAIRIAHGIADILTTTNERNTA